AHDCGGGLAGQVETRCLGDQRRDPNGDRLHLGDECVEEIGLGEWIGTGESGDDSVLDGPDERHSSTMRYRFRTTLVKYRIEVTTTTRPASTRPVGMRYRYVQAGVAGGRAGVSVGN